MLIIFFYKGCLENAHYIQTLHLSLLFLTFLCSICKPLKIRAERTISIKIKVLPIQRLLFLFRDISNIESLESSLIMKCQSFLH